MGEIKKAYGEYWGELKDYVDENGYISLYKKDWGDLKPKVSKMELQHGPGLFWRSNILRHLGPPKALESVL